MRNPARRKVAEISVSCRCGKRFTVMARFCWSGVGRAIVARCPTTYQTRKIHREPTTRPFPDAPGWLRCSPPRDRAVRRRADADALDTIAKTARCASRCRGLSAVRFGRHGHAAAGLRHRHGRPPRQGARRQAEAGAREQREPDSVPDDQQGRHGDLVARQDPGREKVIDFSSAYAPYFRACSGRRT